VRKASLFVALLPLGLLVACGDNKSSSSTTTAGTTTRAASATSGGATTTTAATTTGARVDVTITDRKLESGAIKAGAVDFVVKNGDSRNEHEFVVIKGDSYASLPKQSNGAVNETQLAAGALLGRTEKIKAGSTATKSFTLAAGKYVLLCNISNGPTSHAASGQVLDVTVT
jgi:hypothetical protein